MFHAKYALKLQVKSVGQFNILCVGISVPLLIIISLLSITISILYSVKCRPVTFE